MRRAVLPLLLVLATASTASAATNPIATAAAKTVGQRSEQVSLQATIDLGGSIGKVQVNGAGPYDQRQRRGTLKGTLSLAGAGKTPVTEVFDGDSLYVKSPLFAPLLSEGRTWLGMNLRKPAKIFGFDLGGLAGQSPTGVLATLKAVSGATAVGNDQVGGVATTHYRATSAPKGGKPPEAWVDGSGLVRRAHLDYTLAGDPAGTHVVLDMTFSDFGTTVKVTPPPPAQVASPSGLGG